MDLRKCFRPDGERRRRALGSSICTNGLNDAGLALDISSSGDVYVGGRFTMAGGVPASHVARWDGVAWHPLESGVNGDVEALTVASSGDVYAGGFFDEAGGSPAGYVAHFDGTSWHSMNGGANNFVLDLAVDSNGDVYAAGWFTQIGGITTTGIARWDGSQWNAVGGGVNGSVYAVMIHSNGDVYIGGTFTIAGGTPAPDVARWDGTQWHAVGDINGGIRTFVESPVGEVFAGGVELTDADVHVARWDEGAQTWVAVGPPIDAGEDCFFVVTGLAVGPTHLYASSGEDLCIPPAFPDFTLSVAEWDGNDWLPLGSGANAPVLSIGLEGDDLFVTGHFTEAGANPSFYFGRWNEALILESESSASAPSQVRVVVAPNPSVSEPRLHLSLQHPTNIRVTIYDVLGRLIRELASRDLGAGNHVIDIGKYDSGVYLVLVDLTNQQGLSQRVTRQVAIME